MASHAATRRRCPECGYETAYFLIRCPMCDAALLEREVPVLGESVVVESNRFSFSLSTLMLVLTLACVGMGGIVAAPGLAIPLLVIAVPALARTWATGRREMQRGRSWNAADKAAAMALSMGLMLLISAAGCIAFCVACFAGCWGAVALNEVSGRIARQNEFFPSWVFAFAIGLGVLTAAALVIYLMWRNWPRQER